MALKTPKSESTDLAVTGLNLPATGAPMVQVSSPDSRLPTLKIMYPMEIDPAKGMNPEFAYTAIICSGESVEQLDTPYTLTVLAARDAVRQLEVEVNGVKVKCDNNNEAHKKLDKSFTRAFKALGSFNKSHADFEAGLKNDWEKGSVYLVAVVCGEKTLIAELPAFKTGASYWYRPLAQAILNPNRLGCEVTLKNHAVNIKSAKSDATKKYLDPAKFQQYKIVELAPKQIEQVVAAVTAAKSDIDGWFQR